MTACIAVIRGINVGRAKRVAMADLRGLFSGLGHQSVRTVLNSGNVLFHSASPSPAKAAAAIQGAIAVRYGFSAAVAVITAKDLAIIVKENPLLKQAIDPSRHLVAFPAHPRALEPLRGLLEETWAPDALAIGSRAAYLWCAAGILDSRLPREFARQAKDTVTTRNWATVLKLAAA